MTFCILPNIHFGEFPLGDSPPHPQLLGKLLTPHPLLLGKLPTPQLLESTSLNLENNPPQVGGVGLAERLHLPPFINKTLFKYLNIVKEQIDVRLDQWDKYKKCTNPYEYIHTIIPNTKQSVSTLKPISRSFFKMIEICQTLSLLDGLRLTNCKSFHLAEGPGGFIEAMAYMRKNPKDIYYGMTLIDETDHNVPGWRKSKHFLLNNPNVIIEAGIDGKGDLTKAENLRYCYDTYNGQMDIITGDGGVDFSFQYPQQEQVSTKLILCQIAFAIAMQKTGGTFILKVYDTFTKLSLELLFLLYNLYEQVILIKPNTSRFANSEKYVVCKGFRNAGNTLEIVKFFHKILLKNEPLQDNLFDFKLPYLFTNKMEEYNAILGQQQIDTIVSTIYLIDNNNKQDKIEHMKKKYIQKCINWCQKFHIPHNSVIQPNNMFLNRNNGI
jgi:23S rRNA U2552 (ribose-2'-O)-methylase RlmE/FtsJ